MVVDEWGAWYAPLPARTQGSWSSRTAAGRHSGFPELEIFAATPTGAHGQHRQMINVLQA